MQSGGWQGLKEALIERGFTALYTVFMSLDLASLFCFLLYLLLTSCLESDWKLSGHDHSKVLVLTLDELLFWWGNMRENATKIKIFLRSSLCSHVTLADKLASFWS